MFFFVLFFIVPILTMVLCVVLAEKKGRPPEDGALFGLFGLPGILYCMFCRDLSEPDDQPVKLDEQYTVIVESGWGSWESEPVEQPPTQPQPPQPPTKRISVREPPKGPPRWKE